MVVGIAKIELYFPEPNSLKAKRQILRALLQKIEANFKKVSVAEVDGHDLWQSAVIGISIVGKDQGFVDSKLTSLIQFIQKESALDIVKAEIEYLSY
ncbi:MAG: DUF503 domain-containing protein [Caldimicrobium sp.]|jgi:uncharacterized protein YlxP (DUF503 family)|uniref:DUF503 domain-containing protein n=1 Tax=Caldimicrobium thiodismutans TaxID=1653476 RepID=A0A2N7PIY1_9BACT|nr:MAG: DUF503 domain-containing protein [Caldimicrobium thiodismutans]